MDWGSMFIGLAIGGSLGFLTCSVLVVGKGWDVSTDDED